jgi:hypothetical protein
MTDKKVWLVTGAGRGMGVDIAGGGASARATVWPVSEQLPAQLTHHRFHGISEALSEQTPTSPPVSVGVFNVDDLAEDGPPLVSATYSLATGLFQGFGHPEALQMTSTGVIRIRYWGALPAGTHQLGFSGGRRGVRAGHRLRGCASRGELEQGRHEP